MDFSVIKKMCRLLDYQRRACFEREWQVRSPEIFGAELSQRQLAHLMNFRLDMPCNLNHVMKMTGLSSSAASLFVDKLVKMGVLRRTTDSQDRRNVLLEPTAKAQRLFEDMDKKIDELIEQYLEKRSEAEREMVANAVNVICEALSHEPETGKETKRKGKGKRK